MLGNEWSGGTRQHSAAEYSTSRVIISFVSIAETSKEFRKR